MTTEDFQKLRPGERVRDKFGNLRGTVKFVAQTERKITVISWDEWPQDARFDVGDAWMLGCLRP